MPDGQSQLCIDKTTLPQALHACLSSPLPSPRCHNHKWVAPRHVQACLGRKPAPCGVHQSTFSCGIALNLPTAAGIHQQRAGPAHCALGRPRVLFEASCLVSVQVQEEVSLAPGAAASPAPGSVPGGGGMAKRARIQMHVSSCLAPCQNAL